MRCRVDHACLTLVVAYLQLTRIAFADTSRDKSYAAKLKTHNDLNQTNSVYYTNSASLEMKSEKLSDKSNSNFPLLGSFNESSEFISAYVQAIGGKHALRHAEGGQRNALIRHGRSRVHRAHSSREQLRSKEEITPLVLPSQIHFEETPYRNIAESIAVTKDTIFEVTTSERSDDTDAGETLQKYFGTFSSIDNTSTALSSTSHRQNTDMLFNYDHFLSMDATNINKSVYHDDQTIDDELSNNDVATTKQSTRSAAQVDVDVVTRFLRIVESQHLLGENCTAGTDLNLGEGVVDRYAQERFRVEADVAVNRANMLTRLWKYAGPSVMHSEYLLHASVFSMVEFDDDIFAAGNCYDQYQYKDYQLFCPFAYRLPEGPILVKDLAVEYKYLSNTSEWFYIARKNAERVIRNHNQFSRGFNTYTYNDTAHSARQADEILSVSYDDGKWSKPYYDCGGGNIWMLTYTVPFFGYANGTYFFKGTSGIDIDLRRVDIDQCPQKPDSTQMNIFAATDKCKKNTTECVSLAGLGFRRGSYRCVCRRGFYFPHASALPEHQHYDGALVEEHYEKLMLGEESEYALPNAFECAPCAEGCEACTDASPCVAALNWPARTAILAISIVVIACLPAVVYFTIKYGHIKVVRAASPTLLRMITLGALLMYSTALVAYARPTVYACAARVWLREIGFSLTYGALMLKTWRISVIFRVRSAKAVRITDSNLLQRLGAIVGGASAILGMRTLVSPPAVVVGRTADDLKAYLCKTDWWDHAFTLPVEAMFLLWGIRLCITVRKAPSEFNESRFISLAIYNEFILSIFLNISMLFLQSPANPDLLYIILFCHTQLTVTILLCIIFGSKAYMVYKGMGKAELENSTMYSKSGGGNPSGKFASKSRHGGGAHSQYVMTTKSDRHGDFQDEFEKLCLELESLRTRKLRAGNKQLAARIAAMQDAAVRADSSRDGLKLNTVLSAVADKLMCAAVTPAEDSSSSGRDHPFDIHLHAAPALQQLHHKPRVKLRSDNNNGETVVVQLAVRNDEHLPEPLPDSNGGVFKISGEANCGDIHAPGPDISLEKESILDSDNKRKDDLEKNEIVTSVKHSPSSSNDNSSRHTSTVRSGHARTHAIVINLDDKSRFTEEVTV